VVHERGVQLFIMGPPHLGPLQNIGVVTHPVMMGLPATIDSMVLLKFSSMIASAYVHANTWHQ